MKIRLAVIMGLTIGVIFSQIEMNYSYEMQYGNGKQVAPLTQDTMISFASSTTWEFVSI